MRRGASCRLACRQGGEQEIAHTGQRQRQFEDERQPQNQAAVGIEGPGIGDPHLRHGVAPFDL